MDFMEDVMDFKFLGNVLIFYQLEVVTGLHIGGSKERFEIGGLDNPVVKLPEGANLTLRSAFDQGRDFKLTEGVPYIPGSSIKGKLRSNLEWLEDDINDDGSSKFKNEKICKLFGAPANEAKKSLGPVRIRVFDAYPTNPEGAKETELKIENNINRLTSKATPRNLERVVPGTVFEGEFLIKLFQKEDADLVEFLAKGLRLLEEDTLGGGGSRGSGKVRFSKFKVVFKDRLGQKKLERLWGGDGNFEEFFQKVSSELKNLLQRL